MSKFYTFNQNNSGGSFDHYSEKGISSTVIIEATSAGAANTKAEEIGIYFDGCEIGVDCECCGDRWSEADESDGYDFPSRYGKPIEVGFKYWALPTYVHYMDGTFKEC
jgi:hypothetical protein